MKAPMDVDVNLEFTPNPNTLKYSVNYPIIEHGAVNFTSKLQAQAGSPLAAELFEVEGVAGVMLGKNFVTITKAESGDWDLVHKSAFSKIHAYLSGGEPVLTPGLQKEAHKGGGSDIENKICEILDQEIRPAVAMDGGDITFERFENGVVYLYLQGSCSGCPSSTATLKVGIQTRLMAAIPEVKEVISI